MPQARSTKYPTLKLVRLGVSFKGGKAEVTAKQAAALRRLSPRFGITVEGGGLADAADKPLDKRTVAQLDEYAKEHGIDLGDAKTKAEMIAVIEKASEARSADEGTTPSGADS
ncbi:hypothetical protein G1H11_14165 [Phytoactinopolyspora alkaliphila]|uniref:Rho termination factor N-terminal domain-containing protein n=1 Tax=Phytoactinopolyspora alkaliphila TaxID=1783498 RepID=A0A6N9YN10_9ACTN|nr:hypothetical protein [Phytoactinopolyspora alkaliphila]NED96451.1 hypothetical protein [Phytoactinopolyspora alkaliphila]